MAEDPSYNVSDNVAVGIGMCVLILLIAVSVAIFITNGEKMKKFEFLESEDIETEYGVTGMVKEQKESMRGAYVRNNVIGACLCICSVIPLFLGLFATENEGMILYMVCVLLFMVGIGVTFFISVGIPMEGMEKLLEEGDYTSKKKRANKITSPFAGVYWLLAIVIYLAYSLITNEWDKSWIVWPIAGVLFPAYHLAVSTVVSRRDNRR